MSLRTLLRPILDDEYITRGLDDAEARLLIDWLVERVEQRCAQEANERRINAEVSRWCRRARALARFVALWCHERSHSAALQLAATERFSWPLPVGDMDAYELLGDILAWESIE